MAITTLSEVKKLLLISTSDTTKDELIKALIPIVEDVVTTYCGTDFKDADGNLSVPVGIKLPIAKLIGWNLSPENINKKSESLGDYSVSYSTVGSYPKELLSSLDMYAVSGKIDFSSNYNSSEIEW